MSNHRLIGITVAVTKMDEMVKFYQHVFKLEFTAMDMFNSTLYRTDWQGVNLLFCPAEIAQNDARVNRHQPDLLVDDIKSLLETVVETDGKIKDDPAEYNGQLVASIYDPDGNSIVFYQDLND